jgi:hypothetical protein
MTNSIDAFIAEFTEIKAQFQRDAQVKLKEVFAEFWEKNPGIKTVIWTQYAPYFNDGEPCKFSVCDACFTNAEGSDLNNVSKWGEYDGDKEDIWVESSFDPRWCKLVPEAIGVNVESCSYLSKLLCSDVLEDVMEAMFGSDSKIYATRAGFEVEDFGGKHD